MARSAEEARLEAQRRADAAGAEEFRLAAEAGGKGGGGKPKRSKAKAKTEGDDGAERRSDESRDKRKKRADRTGSEGDSAGSSAGAAEEGGGGETAERSMSSRFRRRQQQKEAGDKKEAKLQRAKAEASKRVGAWAETHRHDIYALLQSLRSFGPPLFAKDPLGSSGVEREAKSLRKAYHKVAARLHPDKVRGESVHVQALAEELFKVLGELFKAELARLEATDETAALTLSA